MAEGYARVSGKPGVVLVTSGPGATNVVTPMANALADGTLMVVFSGQVRTMAIGSDAFQEADILGISRGCTKWNVMVSVMVRNLADLPRRINEAFDIATSGRLGPVLVDLPIDITAGILKQPIPMVSTLPPLSHITPRNVLEIHKRELNASIRRAADIINNAESPVILAGHGIICSDGGRQALKELANKGCFPVTTTLHGLGAFDELDRKSLHMLGMHGAAYANMAIQNADVIIALGARFDELLTANVARFAPKAQAAAKSGRGGMVHFEVLPKNINKIVQATEAVEGDVGTNLRLVISHIAARSESDRQAWFAEIDGWKQRWPLSDYGRYDSQLIKPQTLIEELSKLTADRKYSTIITTGVGQHQMWVAQYFRWRYPRTIVTSGGLGTMGFGLPAAIRAKVARHDALVIDVDGDASFCMRLQELSTAVQSKMDVKVIVLNNEEQGTVTQWQNLFREDRYSHTHQKNSDFLKIADSMGLQSRRVSDSSNVVDDLRWLIGTNGPALLEVVTDKKVHVLPMVPGASGLDDLSSETMVSSSTISCERRKEKKQT